MTLYDSGAKSGPPVLVVTQVMVLEFTKVTDPQPTLPLPISMVVMWLLDTGKLFPVIVSRVPPEAGPLEGDMLLMVAAEHCVLEKVVLTLVAHGVEQEESESSLRSAHQPQTLP